MITLLELLCLVLRLFVLHIVFTSIVFPFEKSYQGNYELHMFEVESHNKDSKSTMKAKVISRLLEDMLRLQTKVFVPNPEPVIESKIKTGQPLTKIPMNNLFDLKLIPRKKQTRNRHRNIFYLKSNLGGDILDFQLTFGSKLLLSRKAKIDQNLLHQSLSPIVEQIRSKLSPANSGSIKVETTPDRASFYVGDTFIGKTPATATFLPPGKYKVSLKKDGYLEKTRYITVSKNENRIISEILSPPQGTASLQINSTPSGARVYIGPRYAGLTPLNLENIPEVDIKLRVTLAGYLNQYRTARLEPKQKKKLSITMEKGDSLKLKQKAGYLFPSLKYYDAFWGNMTLGGAFFGAHIYYLTDRDRKNENAILYPDTAATSYAAADSAQQMANIMLAASGVTVVAASIFYIWHLESLGEGFFSSEDSTSLRFFSRNGSASIVWSTSF